jgi:SAM-dependent methyltransferase
METVREENAVHLKRTMKQRESSIVLSRADQIIAHVKGPWVLDIGCAGHVPEPDSPYWIHGILRNSFPHVVGIDIKETSVRQLIDLGYQNIYTQNAESFDLPYKFDTIVAGEVIEHLNNPALFLERMKAHLAPGGSAIITTPYPFSAIFFLYALFKFPKTCQNIEHTFWFCPTTFKELAQRVGLRMIHWELIHDYRFDNPSLRYRAFVKFIFLFYWLIPKRLRCNTMLFILEAAS